MFQILITGTDGELNYNLWKVIYDFRIQAATTSDAKELLKALIGFIDVAGLYFALTQLTHKNISQNHKFQVVGLGCPFAESVLDRLAPLWVGARGLEFTWDYILQGLEANANLENFSLFMVEMAQAQKVIA
ncbi:hypothetical protein L1987_46593 [Smallanthus sonchifolius]|uniref:Uncharacterized protein n=1 Tax=Smallanthus sonchifolius TaxID=185202 RepID=A0ACB9G0U1_9ASTR|nr:hypothetical protein L1987_46593 [Smallanthus sonchifolius]